VPFILMAAGQNEELLIVEAGGTQLSSGFKVFNRLYEK
jgi:hypothetical protein